MEHPNLKRAWIEWVDEREVNGTASFLQPVLVVETDLNLAPGHHSLDSSTLEDVVQVAREEFENRMVSFKRIRIVPAGVYGSP